MNHDTILQRQLDRYQRRSVQLQHWSNRYSQWRILTFIGGLIGIIIAFNLAEIVGYGAILAWILGFGLLIYRHRKIKNMITRFKIAAQIKRETLARLRLDWTQLPPSTLTANTDHPFAADLDLLGDYSVHRLLDTTFSQGGSARLRDWLLTVHPDLTVIQERQGVVQELTPLRSFRDRLALQARQTGIKGKWDGERLRHWLAQDHGTPITRAILLRLGGLALVNAILFGLYQLGIIGPIWIITLIVYIFATGAQFRNLLDLFGEALTLENELERLSAVLGYLETYQPRSARLAAWFKAFQIADQRPSKSLRRIQRVVAATSIQRNPILWFTLNILMPWDVFFGYQLAQNKQALAKQLPEWLKVLYELEALLSLATFADLHPSYTFPHVDNGRTFSATAIGHPLIPARVKNDFTIQPGEVVIITGSNMSGKSSFLRTLGVNLILAYAGSVVCAESLHTGLFRVFTCIKVSDSVVDGISYFYAEVRRLKALLNALQVTDALPLFFLIDEIFRGTNNRERLIGSRAYIEALLNGNGCGLISTHDLELIHLEESFSTIRNYHFREQIRDNRMQFDYQLRRGGSPTTNALRIMAIEGLPISLAPEARTSDNQPEERRQ
ncbi:MAG: hypothetical protein MUF87_08095 [Anaerolineae bacterium]|jgi:hypothetical protein|nr:hypothetical protein [Anaerolineae bacterium]